MSLWTKFYGVNIQMKPIQLYFYKYYLISCQLVLMAKSADECYSSNKISISTTFVRSLVVQNFIKRNLIHILKKYVSKYVFYLFIKYLLL